MLGGGDFRITFSLTPVAAPSSHFNFRGSLALTCPETHKGGFLKMTPTRLCVRDFQPSLSCQMMEGFFCPPLCGVNFR